MSAIQYYNGIKPCPEIFLFISARMTVYCSIFSFGILVYGSVSGSFSLSFLSFESVFGVDGSAMIIDN